LNESAECAHEIHERRSLILENRYIRAMVQGRIMSLWGIRMHPFENRSPNALAASSSVQMTGLSGSYARPGMCSQRRRCSASSGHYVGKHTRNYGPLTVHELFPDLTKTFPERHPCRVFSVIYELSRQRSRVRVSSSPPFIPKHLRWFSRNHRGPKRARFCALFCVPFRPANSRPRWSSRCNATRYRRW
jgi:hypothetical protein